MNVYFIYRHGKHVAEPYLYAVTDKKELKDSFLLERKKSMFIAKKKDIDKSEYKHFIAEHSGYVLGRRGFETSTSSSSFNRTHVYLTATAREEMDVYVNADRAVLEVGKYTKEYSRCFNSNILRALDTLHYFEIYKFRNNEEFHYDDYFVAGVTQFSLDSGAYVVDGFTVFMFLYGETIDRKEILKL